MVIYSKEFVLIFVIWLTFFGYSNKVTRNLKGFSNACGTPYVKVLSLSLRCCIHDSFCFRMGDFHGEFLIFIYSFDWCIEYEY